MTNSTPTPRFIRADLDAAAVDQVARLFDATPAQILVELLQNARQAGATAVDVTISNDTGRISVTDDGCGVTDPKVLLSFGRNGWNDEVVDAENPAGVGFLHSRCST